MLIHRGNRTPTHTKKHKHCISSHTRAKSIFHTLVTRHPQPPNEAYGTAHKHFFSGWAAAATEHPNMRSQIIFTLARAINIILFAIVCGSHACIAQ